MNHKKLAMAVAGACAVLCSANAAAIGFTQGDWSLDINGTVNAFVTNGKIENTNLTTRAVTETKRTNVQNGLLPGWINFVASTKQEGYDVKGHFGFAPGINSASDIVGLPSSNGSAFSQIDTRNAYLSFGKADMGTFKFGRDIGLFMQNPILNDMTLLGVGGTVRAAEGSNTSFGMIGHGYMYTGFIPQITYTSPNMGGLQGSIGMFNPSQLEPNLGTEKRSPGVQGLVTYDWKGGTTGRVWAAVAEQKTHGTGGLRSSGFEGGVKVGVGAFEGLVGGFTGKGIGESTVGAQFNNPLNVRGQRLESDGYFVQAMFNATPKLKTGVNYGRNKDKDLNVLGDADRKSYTVGAYYKFLPAVSLVAEYNHEKGEKLGSTAGSIVDQKANSVSLGAILFF